MDGIRITMHHNTNIENMTSGNYILYGINYYGKLNHRILWENYGIITRTRYTLG